MQLQYTALFIINLICAKANEPQSSVSALKVRETEILSTNDNSVDWLLISHPPYYILGFDYFVILKNLFQMSAHDLFIWKIFIYIFIYIY